MAFSLSIPGFMSYESDKTETPRNGPQGYSAGCFEPQSASQNWVLVYRNFGQNLLSSLANKAKYWNTEINTVHKYY